MAEPSRHSEIRAIYEKHGGSIGLSRLTHYCWDEGVWTDEEQHNMAFAAATRECQRAISTKDAAGLPYAGPTPKRDEGARVWRQLSLWDYDDAVFNLGMRINQTIERDWSTVVSLRDYIQERYGQAPPIPTWELPSSAPLWWRDMDDGDTDNDT